MRWPRPMLLSDFINQLLGMEKAEEITNAVHEEAEAKVLQMWQQGEVFFNHVVRRSERPTEETLRRAYRRGAALLLPHNSPGADILIPVHDPDENEMSCFLIQVKNRISDAPTKTLRLQASADLAKAATVLSLDCPYLAMMMCLRTSPSTSPGCEILDPQKKRVQMRPATRRLQSMTEGTSAVAKSQKSKKSNRILTITYGLDEAVYPVLRQDSEQASRTVDRLRSLLDCLPMTVVPQNDNHRIYLTGLEGL
ncbi:hypothetical protein POX_g09377 [Penicillium oxalicum]|uniref:hypothetical protein n=1 Tax=Penicillium oxalicum TaxID=69781 RepID=UPI0020B74C56|nr:hypothetical protein POX_g09377 [Penicillium oxalicum]KAI2786980.1 hypothetical protein POX_g09377 [Penicillium oxalicum]